MMNLLKKLLGRNQNLSEKPQETIDPKYQIQKISNDCVQIAVTEDFAKKQESVGNFLPDEMEEAVAKILPRQATAGSAGIDLRAYIEEGDSVDIAPGETKLIKTGFKWAIPKGNVGIVCSRSGLALKNSVFVLNAPGIVDSDYRGDVGVILHNAGKNKFTVNMGDRIAQMVILETSNLPVIRVLDIDVTETERSTGGFGSTGKG